MQMYAKLSRVYILYDYYNHKIIKAARSYENLIAYAQSVFNINPDSWCNLLDASIMSSDTGYFRIMPVACI